MVEDDRRLSKKLWYSSAVWYFIICSVIEDQFTLKSEGSESIPESTYTEQYCKNIFLKCQEAINQYDREVWREQEGAFLAKEIVNLECYVQWHGILNIFRRKTFLFKNLLEINRNFFFLETNETQFLYFSIPKTKHDLLTSVLIQLGLVHIYTNLLILQGSRKLFFLSYHLL